MTQTTAPLSAEENPAESNLPPETISMTFVDRTLNGKDFQYVRQDLFDAERQQREAAERERDTEKQEAQRLREENERLTRRIYELAPVEEDLHRANAAYEKVREEANRETLALLDANGEIEGLERELAELKAAQRWIPVAERPDIGGLRFKHFLICNPSVTMIDMFVGGKFSREDSMIITHYRELPAHPSFDAEDSPSSPTPGEAQA